MAKTPNPDLAEPAVNPLAELTEYTEFWSGLLIPVKQFKV